MSLGTYIAGGLNTLSLGVVGSQSPAVRTFIVHKDGSVTEDENMRAARDYSAQRKQGTLGAVGLTVGAVAGGMALQSRLGQMMLRFAESEASTLGISAARWGVGIMQGSVGLMGALGVGGALLALNGTNNPATDWLKERMTPSTVVHKFYDESGTLLGEKNLTRAEEQQQQDSGDPIDVTFDGTATDTASI